MLLGRRTIDIDTLARAESCQWWLFESDHHAHQVSLDTRATLGDPDGIVAVQLHIGLLQVVRRLPGGVNRDGKSHHQNRYEYCDNSSSHQLFSFGNRVEIPNKQIF